MIASLLSIEIRVHVIDNGNNEIRGGGVERDAGRDEKQLIKFAWPNTRESLIQLTEPQYSQTIIKVFR